MMDRPSRPRAFRLEDGKAVVVDDAPAPRIEEQPDAYAIEAESAAGRGEVVIQQAQRRGVAARVFLTVGGVFWSALGALVLLALTTWFTSFVEDLYARAPALGWVGLALAVVAALALLVMAGREIRGVLRQRHIARLHMGLAKARAAD
ncbi:MAG TPA: TIGR01620 family protein, partial [Beijerinckiaceae bacterium]